ncbi:IgG receptor FcRn large subunit p51 isoform X1 [Monodelphis domestica]|uniref:IgG receptor FcRn large subunit p51 n=2 Tax=Monodelphis domestica TaxID=13616 RepID=F6UD96_MONDO|nr:IgG receptor FcRn large subunit p51 isoform X1 [Monodelphis domestica]
MLQRNWWGPVTGLPSQGLRMGSASPSPQGLPLRLALFLPLLRVLSAGTPSLFYQLTAVAAAPPGTPSFWASGWLGPQLFLTYSSGGSAEPWGAWRWEHQEAWFWEKETWYLKTQERLLQEALRLSKGAQTFQGLVGCQLNPNNSAYPTSRFALDGMDFLTFDPVARDWLGNSEGAQAVRRHWANETHRADREAQFLLTTCPEKLRSHLQNGKGNFQWKEAPEVRAGGHPGPGDAQSTLTCQAFSFFPPEVKLTFLREGKPVPEPEKGAEPWPNRDGAFHSQATLQVQRGDEARYSCEVRHPALATPLTVSFEASGLSLAVIGGLVAACLLILLPIAAVVALVMWKKRGRPAPWIFRGRAADDVGALLSAPGPLQDSSPS